MNHTTAALCKIFFHNTNFDSSSVKKINHKKKKLQALRRVQFYSLGIGLDDTVLRSVGGTSLLVFFFAQTVTTPTLNYCSSRNIQRLDTRIHGSLDSDSGFIQCVTDCVS